MESPQDEPLQPALPLSEVVSNAVDKAEPALAVTPELIAEITQTVLKQLQSPPYSVNGPPAQQPLPSLTSHPTPRPLKIGHHVAPPAALNHPQAPPSPSTTASNTSPIAPSRLLTPPSPHAPSDSIEEEPVLEDEQDPITYELAPSSSSTQRSASPASHSSRFSVSSHDRPNRAERCSGTVEETTLEKIWGPMFSPDSRPTHRLSQLLRGLATHLIEDFEPKRSLVVTPAKMLCFYKKVGLEEEAYPWSIVFDQEQSSISRMYRDQLCEHHLVQERFNDRPDIPGLTPLGFDRWMTRMLLAQPDNEFERLKKAVLTLPISNPDDRTERFPKEISRRLFPTDADMALRRSLEESMIEHVGIDLPWRPEGGRHRHTNPDQDASAFKSPRAYERPSVSFVDPDTSSGRPEQARNGQRAGPPSNFERQRAPYSSVPDSAVIDDTNPSESASDPSSRPIERERKPWVSQGEGRGKRYEAEDGNNYSRPPYNDGNRYKPRSDSSSTVGSSNGGTGVYVRAGRSNSSVLTGGRTRPISILNSPGGPGSNTGSGHSSGGSNSNSFNAGPSAIPHSVPNRSDLFPNLPPGVLPRASAFRKHRESVSSHSSRHRSPSFNRFTIAGHGELRAHSHPTLYPETSSDLGGNNNTHVINNNGGGNNTVGGANGETQRYFEAQARDRLHRTQGNSPYRGDPAVSRSRRTGEYIPADEDAYYHHHHTNGNNPNGNNGGSGGSGGNYNPQTRPKDRERERERGRRDTRTAPAWDELGTR